MWTVYITLSYGRKLALDVKHHNMSGCTYQVAYMCACAPACARACVRACVCDFKTNGVYHCGLLVPPGWRSQSGLWVPAILMTRSPTSIGQSPYNYSLNSVIFKMDFWMFLLIGTFISSSDSAFIWTSQHLTHDKLTLLQVMAWCHQVTIHYVPALPEPMLTRSMSLYMALLGEWVNLSHFNYA